MVAAVVSFRDIDSGQEAVAAEIQTRTATTVSATATKVNATVVVRVRVSTTLSAMHEEAPGDISVAIGTYAAAAPKTDITRHDRTEQQGK